MKKLKFLLWFLILPGSIFAQDTLIWNIIPLTEKFPDTGVLTAGIDKPPSFPGGQQALDTYLRENLVYPFDAQETNVQGTVYLQLKLNKKGSVSSAEIQQGLCKSLNEEALRLTESMPKWIPAYASGKNVASVFCLPVHFKIPGKQPVSFLSDYDKGIVHMRKREYNEAVFDFSHYIEGDSYYYDILFARAACYTRSSDMKSAIEDLEKCNKNNYPGAKDKLSDLYEYQADIYYSRNDYRNAEINYTKAIYYKPDDVLALEGRLNCYFMLGRFDYVCQDYRRLKHLGFNKLNLDDICTSCSDHTPFYSPSLNTKKRETEY